MTIKNIKITDGAKEELKKAIISNNKLEFAGALKNYGEIKKLMPFLEISWSKKDKTHYISEKTPQLIAEILGGAQIVDEKKTFQAFFTPPELAKRVVKLAEVYDVNVLEPSAGTGNLFDAIVASSAGAITAYELNKNFCTELQSKYICSYGVNIQNVDFLLVNPSNEFDCVIMNPPYNKNEWVKHLEHAWKFLKDGGRLVAICPNAKHNRFFQKFIEHKKYTIEDVPAGTFSESGTEIATIILIIDK